MTERKGGSDVGQYPVPYEMAGALILSSPKGFKLHYLHVHVGLGNTSINRQYCLIKCLYYNYHMLAFAILWHRQYLSLLAIFIALIVQFGPHMQTVTNYVNRLIWQQRSSVCKLILTENKCALLAISTVWLQGCREGGFMGSGNPPVKLGL